MLTVKTTISPMVDDRVRMFTVVESGRKLVASEEVVLPVEALMFDDLLSHSIRSLERSLRAQQLEVEQ